MDTKNKHISNPYPQGYPHELTKPVKERLCYIGAEGTLVVSEAGDYDCTVYKEVKVDHTCGKHVIANPPLNPTDRLRKLLVDDIVYNVSDVQANPGYVRQIKGNLTTIQIDGDIYTISDGGGTDVRPNPTEEPTDALKSIYIDGAVFSVVGSGDIKKLQDYIDKKIAEETEAIKNEQDRAEAVEKIINDKLIVLTAEVAKKVDGTELLNYAKIADVYKKTETYSADEIDQKLAEIKQFEFVLVDTLPVASKDTLGKIYLVPKEITKKSEKNIKEEYITVTTDNVDYVWELIGDTKIDLTDYAKTTYVDTEVSKRLKKEVVWDLPTDPDQNTIYLKPWETAIPGAIDTVADVVYCKAEDLPASERVNKAARTDAPTNIIGSTPVRIPGSYWQGAGFRAGFVVQFKKACKLRIDFEQRNGSGLGGVALSTATKFADLTLTNGTDVLMCDYAQDKVTTATADIVVLPGECIEISRAGYHTDCYVKFTVLDDPNPVVVPQADGNNYSENIYFNGRWELLNPKTSGVADKKYVDDKVAELEKEVDKKISEIKNENVVVITEPGVQSIKLSHMDAYTLTSHELSGLTIELPENILDQKNIGFISEVTFRGNLLENGANLHLPEGLVFFQFGKRQRQLAISRLATINLLFNYDGINLCCYATELTDDYE